MARRKTLANLNTPGLIDPSEYNFEAAWMQLAEQFEKGLVGTARTDEGIKGLIGPRYSELDLGIVLGLARAYARVLEQRTRPLTRKIVRGGTAVDSDTALGERNKPS